MHQVKNQMLSENVLNKEFLLSGHFIQSLNSRNGATNGCGHTKIAREKLKLTVMGKLKISEGKSSRYNFEPVVSFFVSLAGIVCRLLAGAVDIFCCCWAAYRL